MWVLLGTSLPKVNTMPIFCDVMSKNGRHQRTVERKANIHDLVMGQWTPCDANRLGTNRKICVWVVFAMNMDQL